LLQDTGEQSRLIATWPRVVGRLQYQRMKRTFGKGSFG